jgi:hypothetical protein
LRAKALIIPSMAEGYHLARKLYQRSFSIGSMAFTNSRRKTKMIRVLVIGSMLLIAQAVPAFAEKITLACSRGPEYIVLHYTFDLKALTVKDFKGDTFPIQVTDDEVRWRWTGNGPNVVVHVYNRITARLTIYYVHTEPATITCQRAQPGPL